MELAKQTATNAQVIEPAEKPLARQVPAASRSNAAVVLIILTVASLLFLFVAVAIVVATLLFWKSQNAFIHMEGELQPAIRRDLFAPDDCEIEAVMVEPGDMVEVGQVLARLRSDQLEAQRTAKLSELQSAKQQLTTARALLVARFTIDDAERLRLAGQIEQWTNTIQRLEGERALISKRIDALNLCSPLVGEVMAGEFDVLPGRPVDRGQHLMRVASVSGPWRLELRAAEARLGAILKAQASSAQPLEVQFRLTAEPDIWYVGVIEEVGQLPSDPIPSRCVIKVQIDHANMDPSALRPGATVKARIRRGS